MAAIVKRRWGDFFTPAAFLSSALLSLALPGCKPVGTVVSPTPNSKQVAIAHSGVPAEPERKSASTPPVEESRPIVSAKKENSQPTAKPSATPQISAQPPDVGIPVSPPTLAATPEPSTVAAPREAAKPGASPIAAPIKQAVPETPTAPVPPLSATPEASTTPPPPPVQAAAATTNENAPSVAPSPIAFQQIPITGKVEILFDSRIAEGPPKLGVRDEYRIDLALGDLPKITGSIIRKPRVLSTLLGRAEQPLSYEFLLTFFGHKPPLSGSFGVRRDGVYTFDAGLGFPGVRNGNFSGRVVGRNEERSGSFVSSIRKYSRLFNGRQVSVQARQVDPIRFEMLRLGAGPGEFPATVVKGDFDYDYETGNWYPSALRFRYKQGTTIRTDTLSGSIKWVEDPNRALNGRGKYEFNLRFNEADYNESGREEAFFEQHPSENEEAFFAVDDAIPGIFGEVLYRDSFGPDTTTVIRSEITYALHGNGLTKTQLVNFLKFWLLITGPANDE